MDEPPLTIESLRELTDPDAEAIASLLVQLSSSAAFDRARTEAVIAHEATELLVARDSGRVVGTATLVTAPSLPGFAGTSKTSWSTRRHAVAASRDSSWSA